MKTTTEQINNLNNINNNIRININNNIRININNNNNIRINNNINKSTTMTTQRQMKRTPSTPACLRPDGSRLGRCTGCAHSTIRFLRRIHLVRAQSTNEQLTAAG